MPYISEQLGKVKSLKGYIVEVEFMGNLKPNINDILVCPKCKNSLNISNRKAICTSCKQEFNKKGNIWDFRI